MEWDCQRDAAVAYWLGVIVFAVSPNWTGLLIGWAICQVAAAIAG